MSTSLQDLKVQALEFMSDFLSRYVKGRGVASAAWREDLAPELTRLAAKLGTMARAERHRAERMREASPSRSARKQLRSVPLRRVGARATRERPAVDAFRKGVLEDAGAIDGVGPCARCKKVRKLDSHHMKARSHAEKDRHDPKQGRGVCRECHDQIESHRAVDWREWKILTKPARVGAAS